MKKALAGGSAARSRLRAWCYRDRTATTSPRNRLAPLCDHAATAPPRTATDLLCRQFATALSVHASPCVLARGAVALDCGVTPSASSSSPAVPLTLFAGPSREVRCHEGSAARAGGCWSVNVRVW